VTLTLAAPLTPFADDGWTENLFAPGQQAVFHYPMDQRAALHWYHDHVMGVTRFDVYAGLAGLWIIRDQRERELGLPEGPPFEVPLLIQDRNFGLGGAGRLSGQLVHKTDPEVMEAFAPFTVVNGKVWPLLELHPATYRFRVLNGSNARTYRLVLLRDGEPELGRITQIGTDHGLLRSPARVPPDGLVLASAERADLLAHFSGLAPGSELTLVNTAGAPFDGASFPAGTGCAGRRAPPHDRAGRARTQRPAQHAHYARARDRRRRPHRAGHHRHRRRADYPLPRRRRPLRGRHHVLPGPGPG
jgi:spore coat protein A